MGEQLVGPIGPSLDDYGSWRMWPEAFLGPYSALLDVEPRTRLNPVALLLHSLILVGHAVGRGPLLRVGDYFVHANEFLLVVGDSALSRKGQALEMVEGALVGALPELAPTIVGPTTRIQDLVLPIARDGDGRLLVKDEEFEILPAVKRNTQLAALFHAAWDSKALRATTAKGAPISCDGPHVSLVGHSQPGVLREAASRRDFESGFLNRFLVTYLPVKWSSVSPFLTTDLNGMVPRLTAGIKRARAGVYCFTRRGEWAFLQISRDVQGHLHDCGERVQRGVLARGEAHVAKLALIYALSESFTEVDERHVRAAYAVWDYCRRSALALFPDATWGSSGEQRIMRVLDASPAGKTATELTSEALQRHGKPGPILMGLLSQELVFFKEETRRGRAVKRWFSARYQGAS